MKRSENRQYQPQAETAERLRIDKMSLHFVLPWVVFYAVVGLLLILLKDLVTNVASWVLAAGLVVSGGWLLLRYFRSEPEKRIEGADLAIGLVLLLAGILLISSPNDMREVFPKVWGLSLIFGGFLKVQYAFDERTVGVKKWWIMLICAVVSLTIGVLALLNRSIFGDSQHLVIGIFMLCEAALDITTYFLLTNKIKKQGEAQAVYAAPAAPAAPPAAPEALNDGQPQNPEA